MKRDEAHVLRTLFSVNFNPLNSVKSEIPRSFPEELFKNRFGRPHMSRIIPEIVRATIFILLLFSIVYPAGADVPDENVSDAPLFPQFQISSLIQVRVAKQETEDQEIMVFLKL